MRSWTHLASGVALAAISTAIVQPAQAQQTTSGINGTVATADGAPAAGVEVKITDTRTGLTRTATATSTGAFDVRNLNVGGPYTVEVSGANIQGTRVEGVLLNLGAPTALNLQVSPAAAEREVVVVTAAQVNAAPVAIGPSAVFNAETLADAPTVNRDIKDIIRLDPRISLDFAAGGAEGSNGVQCAGQHPRFNALTVDGVRMSDDYGLNSNGYPTERIPFSYDSINQVSVELAPFDVQYGGFTACNINAVTKSGGNNFHGGAFFDYTSDSLYGDSTDGIKRNLGNFDEKRYGVNIGGPIIPDTLFFFASYEKLEGANVFGIRPEDKGITQAQYDAVINTAVNLYGYVPGGLPASIPVEDEKIFGKLDWNINDRHRAVLSYTYNDGFNFSPSDNTATNISDGNHYYERGAEAKTYVAALYSDWTDNFSTEVRYSKLELNNRQIPVAGTDFGEVQVNIPRASGGNVTAYLGADDSRHVNKLNYSTTTYKVAGNYRAGDHTLTGGYERQSLDIFNLFLQEVYGEWRFDDVAAFAAGNFNYFEYSNSVGTNDPTKSAADFSYANNILYFQDEWQVSDAVTLTAGLRYERYSSDDKPKYNAAFQSRYGFRNDENMDGRDIWQPRIGITWEATNDLTVRGGFGVFSGGNPNVWLANNYSNDGVSAADFICRNQPSSTAAPRCNFAGLTLANPRQPRLSDFTYPGVGKPFFEVPNQAVSFIAGAAAVGSVNALDPDFEIPAQFKLAVGATYNYDSDIPWIGPNWTINGDILLSKTDNPAIVIPLGYVRTGTAPDGRPIYGAPSNTNDFLLTNSSEEPISQVYSASLSKSYDDFGIDWTLGYAYTDSEEAIPMTSSVAFSNYQNFNTDDPVNVKLATSDYEVKHRITFNVNWDLAWNDRWTTRFSLFGSANQGAPYSYTVGNTAFNTTTLFESAYTGTLTRALAYIPTGVNDPLISPTSNAAAVQQLVDFINRNDVLSDHKGGIAPRNIANDDWYTKFDLKISQDFPGFMGGDSFQGYVVVENLGNLLNDKWGIQREHGFPGSAVLYGLSGIDAQNRYVISSFNPNVDQDTIIVGASLWNVRVGVNYKF